MKPEAKEVAPNAARFKSLVCPDCGVRFTVAARYCLEVIRNFGGKCPECLPRRKGLAKKGKAIPPPVDHRVSKYAAPCGSVIVPAIRSRCDVGDKCVEYGKCLDMAARELWPGWRKEKDCENQISRNYHRERGPQGCGT